MTDKETVDDVDEKDEPTFGDIARASVEKDEPDEKIEPPPQTEETQTADTQELPELSDEQLEALLQKPEVLAKVLGSDAAKQSVDQLIDELVAEAGRTQETEKTEREQQATYEEALKKAEEDGDYGDLGRLAHEQITRQRSRDAVLREYGPQLQADSYKQLDAALAATYGAEIEALSEEEYEALNRRNFDTEADFVGAVVSKLREKSVELARGESAVQLTEAEEARNNAAEAARARGDGNIMLPGGKGAAEKGDAGGEELGPLLRSYMQDALDKADIEE